MPRYGRQAGVWQGWEGEGVGFNSCQRDVATRAKDAAMSPYGERGAELGSRYFGLHAIIVKEGYPDIWEKSTLILSPYRLMVGSVGFFLDKSSSCSVWFTGNNVLWFPASVSFDIIIQNQNLRNVQQCLFFIKYSPIYMIFTHLVHLDVKVLRESLSWLSNQVILDYLLCRSWVLVYKSVYSCWVDLLAGNMVWFCAGYLISGTYLKLHWL